MSSAGDEGTTEQPADAAADHAVATPISSTAPALRVWIPAARPPVVTALQNAGAAVLDDPQGADYAVISTRLSRHRAAEYISHARDSGLSILVLVHPGGEENAVEVLRGGARTAIAEGNIDALRSLRSNGDDVDGSRFESMLSAFESSLDRTKSASRQGAAMVDLVSGLPAEGALQLRLAAPTADPGDKLRIVSVGVPALKASKALRFGKDGRELLHRRIATGMRRICAGKGDLFDIGNGGFVVVASNLDDAEAEHLGAEVVELVGAYLPDGHSPMAVAVGHAGSECSSDVLTLRELAMHAEAAARREESSTVLAAGELERPLATATELEVALRLAQLAAERDGATSRDEIASVAADLTVLLGFEGRERITAQFCAAVADIGAALIDDDSDPLEAAIALLGPIAGPTVGAVLRAVGERWDGSGKPDGLVGQAIPVAARVIAVAEQLIADSYSTTNIESFSETQFDPAVVRAAQQLVSQR